MRECKYCRATYDEGDANYCSYECYVFADLPPDREESGEGSES
jgi:hypothetical protein